MVKGLKQHPSYFLTANRDNHQAFGVFEVYYDKILLRDHSPSKIAWIGSFQLFATFFLFLFSGPLVSKGYFRVCFSGGSLLLWTTLMLVSFCEKWWQFFLVQGILMGTAMGLVFSSGIMILTSYFSTKLGIATAIAAAGSSVGESVSSYCTDSL